MLGSKVPFNHHRSPPESCIVNRQIWVKVSKFLVVTGPLPTGHVTQRMHNGHFSLYSSLDIITAVTQETVNIDTSCLSYC